jgi:hypothetical protein
MLSNGGKKLKAAFTRSLRNLTKQNTESVNSFSIALLYIKFFRLKGKRRYLSGQICSYANPLNYRACRFRSVGRVSVSVTRPATLYMRRKVTARPATHKKRAASETDAA